MATVPSGQRNRGYRQNGSVERQSLAGLIYDFAFRLAGFFFDFFLAAFCSASSCSRVVRMRARSSEAGSSRGSCGTNSPRNALARMDWSSTVSDDSIEAKPLATSRRLSSMFRPSFATSTMACCSARGRKSKNKFVDLRREHVLDRAARCPLSVSTYFRNCGDFAKE